MTRIKTLIVEDELIIAQSLKNILHDLGYEVSAIAVNYTEAIRSLEEALPDIALIDIHLGGRKDGIDIACTIREKYNIPFIFITSNTDQATVSKAKYTSPNGFLVKPFNREGIYTSIEVALFNFAEQYDSNTLGEQKSGEPLNFILNDVIFFKSDHQLLKVRFQDIRYLKAERTYAEVHTTERKHLLRTSLADLLPKLPQDIFLQIHRSYIVNTNYIEAISGNRVLLNNLELPIGKTFKANILNRINIS